MSPGAIAFHRAMESRKYIRCTAVLIDAIYTLCTCTNWDFVSFADSCISKFAPLFMNTDYL